MGKGDSEDDCQYQEDGCEYKRAALKDRENQRTLSSLLSSSRGTKEKRQDRGKTVQAVKFLGRL